MKTHTDALLQQCKEPLKVQICWSSFSQRSLCQKCKSAAADLQTSKKCFSSLVLDCLSLFFFFFGHTALCIKHSPHSRGKEGRKERVSLQYHLCSWGICTSTGKAGQKRIIWKAVFDKRAQFLVKATSSWEQFKSILYAPYASEVCTCIGLGPVAAELEEDGRCYHYCELLPSSQPPHPSTVFSNG